MRSRELRLLLHGADEKETVVSALVGSFPFLFAFEGVKAGERWFVLLGLKVFSRAFKEFCDV